jgi:hypothetical protein
MNPRKIYHKTEPDGSYSVYFNEKCLGFGLNYFEATYAVAITQAALIEEKNNIDSLAEIKD